MSRTVVHFTDAGTFGGAERMLLTLLAGLDRDRWQSVLYHHVGPGIERLVAEARSAGVRTREVPHMHGRRGWLRLPGFVRQLRAERAAIFHAHLVWPLRCRLGLIGARLAGTAGIVATQQLFEPLTAPRDVRRHRRLSRVVDRYVAVSESMAAELRRVCVRPEQKVRVIHNGIALEPGEGAGAAPRETARNRQAPVVLTLARLDWQKGLDVLLDAAARVPGARFAIAGEGAERGRLEALAGSLGVQDRVSFLGHRTDVGALLAAADLFVLPSVLEGLPVSVIEAMAAGKPVIATDVGGTNELVQNGRTGVLVPPRDAAALAAAIRGLIADRELRDRLAAAGRARAYGEFSARLMVQRVSELYDDLLHSARASDVRG